VPLEERLRELPDLAFVVDEEDALTGHQTSVPAIGGPPTPEP
jgi:hypothetical protein